MGRFDRYLLGQLMTLFGFFALILILVFWVNSAVILLDRLLGNGQSIATFMFLTLLSLPTVIWRILAIAAFIATVFVINRLSSESELVVAQASGYSPYRLGRAPLVFGVIATVMIAILSHVLVPMSRYESRLRSAEIAQDLTAQFLTEGTFVHPTPSITFYVREITPNGELRDIYLSTMDHDNGVDQNYTATRALLLDEEDGPMIVMFDGMIQSLDLEQRLMSVTAFDRFAYSLGGFATPDDAPERLLIETDSWDLLRMSPQAREQIGFSQTQLRNELHKRSGASLLALAAVMIGYATLVAGGFSRFGLWRQILFAVGLLITMKMIDNAIIRMLDSESLAWPFAYFPTVFGVAVAYLLMWFAASPAFAQRFSKRRRRAAYDT